MKGKALLLPFLKKLSRRNELFYENIWKLQEINSSNSIKFKKVKEKLKNLEMFRNLVNYQSKRSKPFWQNRKRNNNFMPTYHFVSN